jgi:hypothetical protein
MVYELRNKIPQNSNFLYSEDVLTGTIFGNLRYFSNQKLLKSFLDESINLQNERLLIKTNTNFDFQFWQNYRSKYERNYNEPDIVLYNKQYIIIIECKYFSILDEEYESEKNNYTYKNQLIRYSTIIDEYYENVENKIIIFLTNEREKPVEIMNNTKLKINENIKLYWLSWDKLYKCMISQNTELPDNEKLLFSDLFEFVKKRGLIIFNGFSSESINYERIYHKKYSFDKNCVLIKWRYLHE